MKSDRFSRCHPAVSFIFFLGAIGCGAVINHPAYVIISLAAAFSYSYLLSGHKAFRLVLSALPLAVLISVINPLFSTEGTHILLHIFSRPYTLEALCHGAITALMLLAVMIWFSCYNVVMSGDKFTSLFGNLFPSLSLLLVMILRMIPKLSKKARQVANARSCIGLPPTKLAGGIGVLSAVTDNALDGSIVTADSMHARGYGTAKRTSFQSYTMRPADYILLGTELGLLAIVILFARSDIRFFPSILVQNVSWEIAAFAIYVFLPLILHGKEALQWRRSRSKI